MSQGIQNTSNANPQPVNNGLSLSNGMSPRLIPLNIDLTVNSSVLVDLTQQQQSGQIGPLQTIYINNSGNAKPVTVVTDVLNQSITIPGGDSAILPIFLPNSSPKFTVSSTGGVVVPIAVMNFPLPAQVWGASFGNTYQTVNGLASLNVVDTALQPLITNVGGAGPALDVNILSGGGGASEEALVLYTNGGGTLTNGNINLTTQGTIGTKAFNCVALEFGLSGDAHNGVGEAGFLSLTDSGGMNFWEGYVYVPVAAPATPMAGVQTACRINFGGGIKGTASQNPFFYWGGTSLTGGKFIANAYGYYA